MTNGNVLSFEDCINLTKYYDLLKRLNSVGFILKQESDEYVENED